MYLEIKEVTIKATYGEVTMLYWALKNALARTIIEHWCNHPNAYPEREVERLYMLKQLSRVVDLNYETERKELEDLLQKTVKEKTTK